ncbi:MAG TPA: hypothetical protein VKG78_06885 [Opitutaceae bacterium]|nr:hypothetical protein [Opitutaceae bacterium]
MDSREELTALAERKAELLYRIRMRREVCAAAAERAFRPLEILDETAARWRRLSPFAKLAAVPLGFLLARMPGRRPRALGALMRWGPLVVGAVRAVAGTLGVSRRS